MYTIFEWNITCVYYFVIWSWLLDYKLLDYNKICYALNEQRLNIHNNLNASVSAVFSWYNKAFVYIAIYKYATCWLQDGLLCQQMPLNCLEQVIKASTSCPNSSVQEEEIMATLLGSESSCTGGKRRVCNGSIVTKFTASKITGQGFSRGTEVRETMHVSASKDSRKLVGWDRGLALRIQPGKDRVVREARLESWSLPLLAASALQLAAAVPGDFRKADLDPRLKLSCVY